MKANETLKEKTSLLEETQQELVSSKAEISSLKDINSNLEDEKHMCNETLSMVQQKLEQDLRELTTTNVQLKCILRGRKRI